jgi:hypothetical protein
MWAYRRCPLRPPNEINADRDAGASPAAFLHEVRRKERASVRRLLEASQHCYRHFNAKLAEPQSL